MDVPVHVGQGVGDEDLARAHMARGAERILLAAPRRARERIRERLAMPAPQREAPRCRRTGSSTATRTSPSRPVCGARLPAKWRDLGPRMVHETRWADVWQIGDAPPPSRSASRRSRAGRSRSRRRRRPWRTRRGGARREGAARLHGLDGHLGDGALPERRRLREPGLPAAGRPRADARLRARLQRLPDRVVRPDPRRFIPIMATPFWDRRDGAEVERCAAIGHKGSSSPASRRCSACPTS